MRMTTRFYDSKEWRNLRAKVRGHWRKHGLPCGICGAPLSWHISKAVIVDHKVSRHTRPDLALDPGNLQCVCHACNSRKAQAHADNLAKAREHAIVGVREDGLPSDGSWD